MNRPEIVAIMAKKTGLSEKDCLAAYFAIWEIVEDNISHGEKTHFARFGTFIPRLLPASRRRHPGTKEIMIVPEHYIVRFNAGKRLRQALPQPKLRET